MKPSPRKKRPDARRRGGGRSRRASGQADWVLGYHAVEAVLRHAPKRMIRLHLWKKPPPSLGRLIDGMSLQIDSHPPEEVTTTTHLAQGVAALVRPFVYAELDAISEPSTTPLLLMLDGVTDTRNLGAILRTAGFMGVQGVILARDRAASVNGVVERISRGGSAVVPVAQVTNLARTLQALKRGGWTIVGTALEEGATPLGQLQLDRPTCLVLGAEDRGMRPLVRAQCDSTVTLRARGDVQSLNVASFATLAIWQLLGAPQSDEDG